MAVGTGMTVTTTCQRAGPPLLPKGHGALQHLLYSAGNDSLSSVGALKITRHGVGFSRPRLSIAEDTHAVPVHDGLHKLGRAAEHFLLSGVQAEGMVELEDVTGSRPLQNIKDKKNTK